MGDAVRDGDVRSAELEDTIDAADRADRGKESVPGTALDVVGSQRDYPQLTTVERRHYVITKEIAKGGMGRVLEARDLRLGRDVAIKELLPKNRDAARRFEREARITARLQHPSIIHVYEAGVWPGGEPFYAMPRVPGRSLDKVVVEKQTLAERVALLPHVIAVADALAYAHNENVIHRDLKPANVLVGEFGETVVIDWGLAKDLLGAPGDPKESLQLRVRATAEETMSGAVVGTPVYMPPEQARGDTVDQRADVYALGALLYKVLSGEPPYIGEDTSQVLEQVKLGPPRPVQELVPDAPPELVAIVNKAMARDPDARYITASALAQDLKRFEAGQLVGAHRYTLRQLAMRWLGRHRVAVVVGLAAAIALVSVAIVSVTRIVAAKQRAQHEEQKAQSGRIQLLEEHGRSELLAGRAGAALAYLVGAAEDGKHGGARAFLIADAMRPFEAEVAHIEVGQGNVSLAVRSDGTEILTAGAGDVALWSPEGARARSFGVHGTTRVVALDDTGSRVVAAGEDGVAHVWNRDGTDVAELKGHIGPINAAVFSRDGKRVITGGEDGAVIVWDLATKQHVRAADMCHNGPVLSLELSPSGTEVLSASADATACIFDVATGSVEKQLRAHRARINTASWSPDGKLVITASDDGTARVWNVDTPRDAPVPKPIVAPLVHMQGSAVNVAAILDDGRVVTAAADGVVYVWALPSERVVDATPPPARNLRRFVAHAGAIATGTVSQDERFLVTGGFDGLAKIWDLETGQPVATFEHADVVTSAQFIAGKPLLATASRDGTVRLWSTATVKVRYSLESKIHAIAVARDHTVAVGTDDSRVTLVRGASTTALAGHLGRVFALAFSPDGSKLVTGGEDAESIVWDVATGKRIGALALPAPVRDLEIEADGDTLVVLADDHVELWSIATAQRKAVLATEAGHLDAVAVSPHDGSIAAVGGGGMLVEWTAAGDKLVEMKDAARPYSVVAFSPDGQELVTAGPGLAHVWPLDHGKLVVRPRALEGATGIIRAATFTPDSTRIVTAGDDGRAHVWDADKGKLLGSRDYHEKSVTAVGVDGDTLWIASEDGTLGAWDIHVETRSAAELRTFMQTKHDPYHLDADDVVRGGGTAQ